MTRLNLNTVRPTYDGKPPPHTRREAFDAAATIETFFDEHAERFAALAREADFVVGCMAWLTSRTVLQALAATKHGCQIVVQKEDHLRPGVIGKEELLAMYSRLRCPDRMCLPAGAAELSFGGDPSVDAVRCMGICSSRPSQIVPRMHHKFFVFFRAHEIRETCEVYGVPFPVDGESLEATPYEAVYERYIPYRVWTGSYNATENAARSRENVAIITSDVIAAQYANEWSEIFALSEPLDWTSRDVEPEWRIGS